MNILAMPVCTPAGWCIYFFFVEVVFFFCFECYTPTSELFWPLENERGR